MYLLLNLSFPSLLVCVLFILNVISCPHLLRSIFLLLNTYFQKVVPGKSLQPWEALKWVNQNQALVLIFQGAIRQAS
jgi:hypothetical protein